MIPILFLFQLCILVSDSHYDCSTDVLILDSQESVQEWWDIIYAKENDGKQWDGWPVQSFWYSSDRIIVLHDVRDFSHEWQHSNCWLYYFYHEQHNHEWCEDKPHWKIQ